MSNFLLVKKAKYPLVSVGILAARRRIMHFVHCILHSYESNENDQWLEAYMQGTGLWATHKLEAKPIIKQEKQQKGDWKKRGELMRSAELRVDSRDRITTEFFLE